MTDDDLITDDLITMVREPFAGVRMTTPPGEIEVRGRSIRRHRRQGLAAAGAAVAAVLALVTFAVLPRAHPAAVQLTAWTVTTEPSGIVAVTIRDLHDPAGLQRTLHAHGVPAIVRFHPHGGPVSVSSCMTGVPSRLASIEERVFARPPSASGGRSLLYIDLAAVPKADKITIDAFGGNGISLGLVTHDGRCLPGSSPGRIGMKTIPAGHRVAVAIMVAAHQPTLEHPAVNARPRPGVPAVSNERGWECRWVRRILMLSGQDVGGDE